MNISFIELNCNNIDIFNIIINKYSINYPKCAKICNIIWLKLYDFHPRENSPASKGTRNGKMRIGVPNEIKPNEHRVGLVPSSVKELTSKGHDVFKLKLAQAVASRHLMKNT